MYLPSTTSSVKLGVKTVGGVGACSQATMNAATANADTAKTVKRLIEFLPFWVYTAGVRETLRGHPVSDPQQPSCVEGAAETQPPR